MNNTPKYPHKVEKYLHHDENTVTITWTKEISFSYDDIHEFVTEDYGDDYTFTDVIKELNNIREMNETDAYMIPKYHFGHTETVHCFGVHRGDLFNTQIVSIKEYENTEQGQEIMKRLKKGK